MKCENCQTDVNSIVIHEEAKQLWCWPCHEATKHKSNQAAYVIGDDIPGGYEVKHGICNPDGTPKKYYTKSSMRQAAFEKGLFQADDTPKINHRLKEEQERKLFHDKDR